MAALRYLRPLKHRFWPLSTAAAPRLDISKPIEEELTPYYDPCRFYPARLGDVLGGRYQIATKLGFGSSSTVWLARDLNQWLWSDEKYVAVKTIANTSYTRQDAAESDILNHISKANPRHKGWHFVRRPLDSFTLEHTSGRWFFMGWIISIQSARVIHTDLKPGNIMVKVEDPSILSDAARDEYENPLPQKTCEDGSTVYLPRNDYGPPRRTTGVIRITDFDLAVRGDGPNGGCIQVESCRAPEVIVDAGYTYSADIWSLGVMLWDLLEGKKLFPINFEKYDIQDEMKHLAHITGLLGPPPKEMLDCGRRTSMFYDSDGSLKNPELVPTEFSFHTSINNIQGVEKQRFIEFVKWMIKWRAEERSTAKELLDDPWLY